MTQHQRKLVAKRPCDQAGPARMEGEEGMRKAHARNSQGPTRIRPSYIRLARWQGLAQTKQSVPRVIGSPRGKHRLAGEPPGARDIIICRAGEGPGRADKACWQGVTLASNILFRDSACSARAPLNPRCKVCRHGAPRPGQHHSAGGASFLFLKEQLKGINHNQAKIACQALDLLQRMDFPESCSSSGNSSAQTGPLTLNSSRACSIFGSTQGGGIWL
jgi:hypothetical protein